PTLGNGQILTPGVYCQNTAAASDLTGTLTLSGPGIFIIKLNSALTTASGSSIFLTNGACIDNVYFQVNGAVALGTGSIFRGTILANGAISLAEGASLEGRGLSISGAIALSNNAVTVTASCSVASLGGIVYSDTNTDGSFNGSDTPIGNVVVSLLNGANSAIASTTTNATGGYSFTGLTSGTPYSVSVTTPVGYSATIPGVTGPVTLTSGQNRTGVNVGYSPLNPSLTVAVLVNRSVAQPGDVLSYTIVVTNSGNGPASGVVVTDDLTTGLTYVANSASVPIGTTFTQGTPVSSWSIATIGAGQSVSLTFQAVVESSGILYNTVSVPGNLDRACTSIPMKMCAGDEFTLTAPEGRTNYSWYKDGVLIAGQTSNTLVVSEPGSYSLGNDNVGGQCPTFSCCPLIL
ncbi:MAG: ice-binding family protein, partial [Rudanella sp.]|nr:ice-binding family protein [Rudanella sp.]